MVLAVRTTPTFVRTAKKLHVGDRKALDEAIRKVAATPEVGGEKKGDLTGVRVYKFEINRQVMLLAYQVARGEIILLSLGSHENFYRDLKRR